MTTILGGSFPTWLVVLVGALVVGVIYTEIPQVGAPLLLLIAFVIVVSLYRQGRIPG